MLLPLFLARWSYWGSNPKHSAVFLRVGVIMPKGHMQFFFFLNDKLYMYLMSLFVNWHGSLEIFSMTICIVFIFIHNWLLLLLLLIITTVKSGIFFKHGQIYIINPLAFQFIHNTREGVQKSMAPLSLPQLKTTSYVMALNVDK